MLKVGLFILFIYIVRLLYKNIFIVQNNQQEHTHNSKDHDIIDVDYEEIE